MPYDDPEIQTQDGLIRYIHPDHHVVWDDNAQCLRLSTGAFSQSSTPNGGMSVDLEAPMLRDGLSNTSRIPPNGFGAVRLVAEKVRELGLRIGSDPIPPSADDPGNPYHGQVWNIGGSKRRRKALLEQSCWIKKPASMD